MAGFMDWQAPNNQSKYKSWIMFLEFLCNAMNRHPSPYRRWTPDEFQRWFGDAELIFYQKRSKTWALDETVQMWPNITSVYSFLGNEVLPLLHRVNQTARIMVRNAYRSLAENRALKSKDTSLHRIFAATDVVASNGLHRTMIYIVDRLQATSSSAALPLMGFGIYGGFIHIDTRKNRGASSSSWFNDGSKNIRRKYSGLLSLKDQLAGLQASQIPAEAANLGLIAPSAASVAPAAQAVRDTGEGEDGPESVLAVGVVHDDGAPGVIEIAGTGLADYITPEERAKGIIPKIATLDDWHLNQLLGDKSFVDRALDTAQKAAKSFASKIVEEQEARAEDPTLKGAFGAMRADLGDDPRRRYVQSMVEAMYWKDRYQARSMPQLSSHFNPYPVSGFPALIMLPDRPLVARITSITHDITPGSPTAHTTTSFAAPRFWDEGEPWHFFGGWGEADHGEEGVQWRRYWRRFPYWLNQFAMPTNTHTDPAFKQSRTTPLDRMYEHLLGCKSIPYQSNNAFKVRNSEAEVSLNAGGFKYLKMQAAIRDRDPQDMETNPATLELKEYNRMIAELDPKSGTYAKHTLAYKFWGPIAPYESPERLAERESGMKHYNERYGIGEKQLFEEFLGNRAVRWRNRLVLVGPTFGGGGQDKDAVSNSQRDIIEYMEDLEAKRSLGGGVR